jgi:Flp pilus assembly protein TadB
MSDPAQAELTRAQPLSRSIPQEPSTRLLERRRQAAARVRRRRLLFADMTLGLAIAVIALVIAPGLAIVAILALVVLLGCAGSLLLDRVRARRLSALAEAGAQPAATVKKSRL